jgi:hypothetical protein
METKTKCPFMDPELFDKCQYEKSDPTNIAKAPKVYCWWCEYAEKEDVAKAMMSVPYEILPLIDHTEGKLVKTFEFAKKRNDLSLQICLNNLKKVSKEHDYETNIYNDHSDWSFYFVRTKKDGEKSFAGNGGIIFHDNGKTNGDRNHISIKPMSGWSIHT